MLRTDMEVLFVMAGAILPDRPDRIMRGDGENAVAITASSFRWLPDD